MMIGTAFGIFYPTLRKPETIAEGDNRIMQIRARRKYDLDMLREQYMPNLGETMKYKNSDYQFRAFCTKEELAEALSTLALDMDYTAFKHTPEIKYKDKKLVQVYEGIWSAHLRAFPTGSKYDFTSRARGGKAWRRSDWRGQSTSLSTFDEAVSYTRIENLSPQAKQQLWEMSEEDRRDHKDQEPEVWEDQFAPVVSEGPRELPNGNLDHTLCAHVHTKSARRRCRKAYWK